MKQTIFSILITAILTISVHGQDNESVANDPNFAIGFAPYYTITNGLRLDIDFRTNQEKNHWLVISPQFYYDENNNNYREYIEMTGFGIDFSYRVYLADNSKPKGPHFSPGFTLQFFNIKDEIFIPVEFIQDGQTYFTMEESTETSNVFKLGPNILFGYQFLINNVMYLDIYGGLGFRFSFDNRDRQFIYRYQDWWGDYGYSGILLNGGMRIGVIL